MRIRDTEKLLKQVGFNPGRQDGRSSPKLEAAVAAFQTAWGVRATGSLDDKTASLLRKTAARVATPPRDEYVSVGQRSSDIKVIEKRLTRLGYDVGSADGVYSRQTAAAVKAFKADQGMKASGAIARSGRAQLAREVDALKHAPLRRRVKPNDAQARLDVLTTTMASRRRSDGLGFGEGAEGRSVKNVQRRLRAAGFDPKRSDGVFDERTEGALKNFQVKAGLEPTGRVTPRTWRALSRSFIITDSKAAPSQRLWEKSGAVKATEKLLAKLGFNPGKVDGLFTRSTERAVKAFQAAHGFNQTGKVGENELARLRELAARPRASASMQRLANDAQNVALSMGGYRSQGLCATGVSAAILKTYGVKVWGNGNQIDDNLPRDRFREVSLSLEEALKLPGVILTWESTATPLGAIYGHTAITLGDGRSSASDFIDTNTLGNSAGSSGLRVFVPIN